MMPYRLGNPAVMRGWYGGAVGNSYVAAIYTALELITWMLVIAILVALLRWLWKKGNGK